MSKIEIFRDVNDDELRYIYEQILKGRREGVRPRCLERYIKKVREAYPTLDFGEAWRYAEGLFWVEVGRRYFEN